MSALGEWIHPVIATQAFNRSAGVLQYSFFLDAHSSVLR